MGATREIDLKENYDWSETPPPSLIEVSNVKNKVLKPPISATSNVPLLVVESDPTIPTGALRSAPLGIEVADEDNGLLENTIAATPSLIEVSNVKNKVLKTPISATSNVPLLVVESDPTIQTGALRSAPLGIEVADEDNGLLE